MNDVRQNAEYRGSVHSVVLARRRHAGRRRGKWLVLAALAVAAAAAAFWLWAA